MANRRGKKPFVGGKLLRHQIAMATSKVRDASSTSRPGSAVNGFSMKDEARNTQSHQSFWGPNESLRQRPVAFVSAGFVESLKDVKPSESTPREKSSENHSIEVPPTGAGVAKADVANGADVQIVDVLKAQVNVEEQLFVSDPCDSQKPSNGATTPPPFFFDLTGNKNMVVTRDGSLESSGLAAPEDPDSSEEIILFKGRPGNSRDRGGSNAREKQPATSESRTEIPNTGLPRSKREDISDTHRPVASSSHEGQQITGETPEESEEDAILADYIENMAANSDNDDFVSRLQSLHDRDLGGRDGAFGDIIPGDEEDGTTDGESDADEDNVGKEAEESEDDEEETSSSMDDETLALLLAKQEQLGISDDKLVLFNDMSANTRRGKYPGDAYRSKIQHAGSFSVTEAFGDLDLAGWDQPDPLMNRKGRRRKQAPAFNVSDSELEAALKKAWERDRERKKNRKTEREALRAAGLLGKNVNPDDLRIKYQSGMTLDEIKHELLSFLMSSLETIQFPPMDKQARATLHELANKFKIKSQSTGNNDQRRPVLYRTKRTVKYAETQFETAERHVDDAAARIRRKYFHRSDYSKRGAQGQASASGGRSTHKALVFRDGEIAGASIPELGQENRGRAMLEKMGWAKGMALGALENQGILEPVAQVVKRSKAGLG